MTGIAQWYALQIRPNHESGIQEHLERCESIESYSPSRVHPSKRAMRPLPLFPGYLFARFDFQDRVPILRTPHVFRIVGDERAAVAESEIVSIRQMVESGVGLIQHYSWEPGRRVRIEYGPLAGLEGTILRHCGHDRILLSVEAISRALSAQVEASWLRPLDRAA